MGGGQFWSKKNPTIFFVLHGILHLTDVPQPLRPQCREGVVENRLLLLNQADGIVLRTVFLLPVGRHPTSSQEKICQNYQSLADINPLEASLFYTRIENILSSILTCPVLTTRFAIVEEEFR